MSNKIKFLAISFLAVCISQFSFAQGQGNSPYSAIGIGEISEESNAAQDMMGGVGVANANGFYVNLLNPALIVKNRSLGAYKYVSFSIGLKGYNRNIAMNTMTQKSFGMNLSNITVAFPLKPKWAMAISLKPYSIVDSKTIAEKTIVGTSETSSYEYTSTGGISRLSWVNSFQLAKGLHFGIDANYNFGSIFKDTTEVISSNSASPIRTSNRYSLKGYGLKGGLAYQQKLNKKWFLNLGGTYEIGNKLEGEYLRTFVNLNNGANGFQLIDADTLTLKTVSAGMPSKYKIGVSLESPFHWLFAVDYSQTDWSNTTMLDNLSKSRTTNSDEINAGIEWLPKSNSTKYLNQVFYRVGYRQSNTHYLINGNQIKDRSVSLGVSIPLGFRNPSYIDLGVALGKRGLNTNGMIQENYIKVSANFSLMSAWFIKPKID